MQTLEPPGAVWHIAGGPKTPRRIPEGRLKGASYFGGEPDGFEHLLVPAGVSRRDNAYYRLGSPTRLGPQFGLGAVWGRLDVQAPAEPVESRFVHLLIPIDRSTRTLPKTDWSTQGDTGILAGKIGALAFRITLSLAGDRTGSVRLTDLDTGEKLFEKALTTKIEPQAPVPVTK